MEIVTIDFESFYDSKMRTELAPNGYSLKKMTTEEYVRSPYFQTIGVAVRYKNKSHWMEDHQFRKFCAAVDWSKVAILNHHGHFDGLVLAHWYGVRPARWLDTLSMARALHAHETRLDLGSLMKFFGVGTKGDYYVNMDGKQRLDMTPEEFIKYGEYSIGDADGTEAIFERMVPNFPEHELALIDMTIRMFTEPGFVADEEMLIEFSAREKKRKEDMLIELGVDKKILGSSPKFAALLREHGVEPPMKKSPKWVDVTNEKMIYAFAKTDPGMQQLLEDENEIIRDLSEARIATKSTLDVTRTDRFVKLGKNGQKMPVYLAFHAAHTNRWGGGDKMNWQNLRRVDKNKPDQGIIKRSVMAPGGCVVVRADSSQVEARGSAWFCGQQDLVMSFARGEDVYSMFASDVYQRPINRRDVPDDFIPGFVGKTCILGLGYGMGWYKLSMEFQKGALGGPPLVFKHSDVEAFGIDPRGLMGNAYKREQVEQMPSRLPIAERLAHCVVCDYIVNRYRGKQQAIVAMWKYLNDVIIPAMANEQEVGFGPNNCLQTGDQGVIMPNGLTMKYANLEFNKGEWTYQIKPNKRTKLYGGLFLENIIQSLSRILIGLQALCINTKHPVRTLTHDEVVVISHQDRAQDTLDFMLMVMGVGTNWSMGWPLAAEGGFNKRYGDAK